VGCDEAVHKSKVKLWLNMFKVLQSAPLTHIDGRQECWILPSNKYRLKLFRNGLILYESESMMSLTSVGFNVGERVGLRVGFPSGLHAGLHEGDQVGLS
jgi:hypothetical protein